MQPHEIHPPFSDRALTYGRNICAISATVVVLSWLPGINVKDFQAFGFSVGDKEASVWILLFIVLFYYVCVFLFNAIGEYRVWSLTHKYFPTWLVYFWVKKSNALTQWIFPGVFTAVLESGGNRLMVHYGLNSTTPTTTLRKLLPEVRRVRFLFLKAWILELFVPIFLVALAIASYSNQNIFDTAAAAQTTITQHGSPSTQTPTK